MICPYKRCCHLHVTHMSRSIVSELNDMDMPPAWIAKSSGEASAFGKRLTERDSTGRDNIDAHLPKNMCLETGACRWFSGVANPFGQHYLPASPGGGDLEETEA